MLFLKKMKEKASQQQITQYSLHGGYALAMKIVSSSEAGILFKVKDGLFLAEHVILHNGCFSILVVLAVCFGILLVQLYV